MTKLLGIEFAPLNIPLSRRLETLGALKYTISFLILGFCCLFLSIYIVLCTEYYWVVLLYLLWMYYDWDTPKRGGRRNDRFRRWSIWTHMRNYFPISLIKTAELDPRYNYVLGFHPHGIMSSGAFCNFATEATGFSEKYPGITPYMITLIGQFWFPFYRDYIMQTGACDCSKESLTYLLEESGTGNAIALVVGGAIESLEAHEGSTTIHLKNRKGFIKLALKTGSHLVPIYSFGETDIYDQIPNPKGSFVRNVQEKLQQMSGFAMPVFKGRGVFNYSFGIIPNRRPINTVVGAAIPVQKILEPSIDDINTLHAAYTTALTQLFNTHKVNYTNYKDKDLEIV